MGLIALLFLTARRIRYVSLASSDLHVCRFELECDFCFCIAFDRLFGLEGRIAAFALVCFSIRQLCDGGDFGVRIAPSNTPDIDVWSIQAAKRAGTFWSVEPTTSKVLT